MAIRKVGIVGGGKMSCEVFKLLSEKDFDVVLWTRRPEAAAALDDELKRKLRKRAKKGGEVGTEAEARLARLTVTSDLEALREVDLIIESVAEILHIKREIFARLDQVVQPEAIFTTNTSGLSPSSIALVTSRPERFAGLHFFQPLSLLSFVEVAPTPQTAPEVTEGLVAFIRSTGKRPILIHKEVAAYLVNRLLGAYYHEGCGIASEGYYLPGQIDKICKRFAMMGPCESVDHVGLDVMLSGYESADESWGEKDHVKNQSRGGKEWPSSYFRLRRDGRLGIKTDAGFYRYESGKQVEDPDYFEQIWPDLSDYHCVPPFSEADVEKRVWYSIVLEALVTYERGIGSKEDMDSVLREVLGLERGPFAFIERLGVEKVRETVLDLEARFGPRFAPVGLLRG